MALKGTKEYSKKAGALLSRLEISIQKINSLLAHVLSGRDYFWIATTAVRKDAEIT